MKKLFALFLSVVMLFCLTACGGSDTKESNEAPTVSAQSIGSSFSTENFTYTVTDFQFVESVSMSDYSYDAEDVVVPGAADGNIIAYFNIKITNNGSKKIDLRVNRPILAAGDIEYDGLANGFAQSHCVTSNDSSTGISPLESKEFNYCIFNIPATFMDQSSIELKLTLYEQEYIYTIK